MAVIIDRSIRPFLPETSRLLASARQALGGDSECGVQCEHVGGLHNMSFWDKVKWARDVGGDLILEEKGSKRCEYYPLRDSASKNGYSICMLSFERLGVWGPDLLLRKPIIQSHYRYHDERYPQPAIRYISLGQARTTDVLIFMKDGRLHSPDFASCELGAHTGHWESARGCSLLCPNYIRIFNAHDYLDRIVFKSYREIWEHNRYQETEFDSFQVLLKSPKQQRDGDLTAFQWITQNCKGDFRPMEDEPFERERDEFNFLTDLAL